MQAFLLHSVSVEQAVVTASVRSCSLRFAVPNTLCCECASSPARVYCVDCSEFRFGRSPGLYCAKCDESCHQFAHCHKRSTWASKEQCGVERHLQPCEGLGMEGNILRRMWRYLANESVRGASCNGVAGISALRTSTPAQCPHCMVFDAVARLPQVFVGKVFTECTVEGGNIANQYLPNFYCTSCMHTMFRSSRCQPFGVGVVPDGLLEPTLLSEQDAALWVITFGGYWPATPTNTQTVFRVGAIHFRNAFKYRCVTAPDVRAGHSVVSCRAPGSSLKSFVEALNDLSGQLSRASVIHEAVAMDAFTNYNACQFAAIVAWLSAMQPSGGRGPCAMCFYVRVCCVRGAQCRALPAQKMRHLVMDCDDKPFKYAGVAWVVRETTRGIVMRMLGASRLRWTRHADFFPTTLR